MRKFLKIFPIFVEKLQVLKKKCIFVRNFLLTNLQQPLDESSVIRDTQSKRYAVKLNIHNKLFDWLELTADANLSRTENSGAASFGQHQSNPIWVGLNFSPAMEVRNANGA